MKQDKGYTILSDVWSFGITLVSLSLPFIIVCAKTYMYNYTCPNILTQ